MKTPDTDNPDRLEIIQHAARALFGMAWADYQERSPDGLSLSGCEILDCAPDTPEEATAAAITLVEGVEALNGESITASLARAAALPDPHADRECTPEYFGHYLAMAATGQGVGLESVCDDDALALKLPWCEFSFFDLNPNDYPDLEEED
jgi:hypothetical protein